jgi:hypothetical protein
MGTLQCTGGAVEVRYAGKIGDDNNDNNDNGMLPARHTILRDAPIKLQKISITIMEYTPLEHRNQELFSNVIPLPPRGTRLFTQNPPRYERERAKESG